MKSFLKLSMPIEGIIQTLADASSKSPTSVAAPGGVVATKANFFALCQEQLGARPIHIGVYLIGAGCGIVFLCSSMYFQLEVYHIDLEFKKEANRIELEILKQNLITAKGNNIFQFTNAFLNKFSNLNDYSSLQPYLQQIFECKLTVQVQELPTITVIIPQFDFIAPQTIMDIPKINFDLPDFKSAFVKR